MSYSGATCQRTSGRNLTRDELVTTTWKRRRATRRKVNSSRVAHTHARHARELRYFSFAPVTVSFPLYSLVKSSRVEPFRLRLENWVSRWRQWRKTSGEKHGRTIDDNDGHEPTIEAGCWPAASAATCALACKFRIRNRITFPSEAFRDEWAMLRVVESVRTLNIIES